MDYKYYEQKINDVILKCPIEAGVEILVYNLLDSIINAEELSLVDVNRLRKDRDERLTTDAGMPDIAILSKDFRYREDVGQVYGFVEVKATNSTLPETKQIEGQKAAVSHYIYTNGLVWQYFKKDESKREIVLAYVENKECRNISSPKPVSIDENKFNKLKNCLQEIVWK